MNATAELSLDELTRQLAAVREQLLQLARDDFAGRYELQLEHDRLRRLARTFVSDSDRYRSTSSLRAELETKRQALATIQRDMVPQRDSAAVNIEMRSARGTDALVQRIAHIEEVLERRTDP